MSEFDEALPAFLVAGTREHQEQLDGTASRAQAHADAGVEDLRGAADDTAETVAMLATMTIGEVHADDASDLSSVGSMSTLVRHVSSF